MVYESRDGAVTLYKVVSLERSWKFPDTIRTGRKRSILRICVRSKKETALIPGTDVISVLELLDAVKESLVSGKAVRLSRDSGR